MFRIAAACLAWCVVSNANAEPSPQLPKDSPSCASWSRGGLIRLGGRLSGSAPGQIERLTDTASGRSFERTHRALYDTASGDDGTIAWTQDKSGGVHRLNSQFAAALATSERWVSRRGWCSRGSGGARIERGDQASGPSDSSFRVVPAGGAPIELHFDRGSGQLAAIVERKTDTRLIRHLSHWTRIADGRWFALREVDEYPQDEEREQVDFASVRTAPPRDARHFHLPPMPRDFYIVGGGRSTTVPYEDDNRTRVYVPVTIDGRGPLLFELDSGGHLILTADAAKSLGIVAQGSVNSLGAGEGIMKAGFARVGTIRIGNAVIRHQPIKILPLPVADNDRTPGPPRAGILGLELFERFTIHLDRRRRLMTLSLPARAPKPCGTELALSFTEDAPEVVGAFDGAAGPVELDVGNSGPAIVEGYFAQRNGFGERLSRGLSSSGGGVGGSFADALSRGTISLGSFQLPREVVSYAGSLKRGSEATVSTALNVGEPVLSRFDVTFDYVHQRVCLSPIPGRGPLAYMRAGLKFTRTTTGFVVDSVTPGGPADVAGLGAGDEIDKVNGQSTSQISSARLREILRGAPGNFVDLAVRRQQEILHARLWLREMIP
jgi:hypothetical protein